MYLAIVKYFYPKMVTFGVGCYLKIKAGIDIIINFSPKAIVNIAWLIAVAARQS